MLLVVKLGLLRCASAALEADLGQLLACLRERLQALALVEAWKCQLVPVSLVAMWRSPVDMDLEVQAVTSECTLAAAWQLAVLLRMRAKYHYAVAMRPRAASRLLGVQSKLAVVLALD